MLLGAALAAIPLVALHLALFGFTVPNLQDQSTLLTDFSVPNLVGDLLGLGGGTPMLLRVANLARRRDRPVLPAAQATATGSRAPAGRRSRSSLSLAWLVPWYVIWVLAARRARRRACACAAPRSR